MDVPDPSSPEFSESRAAIIIAVGSVCVTLCCVAAGLRFYVRGFLIRKIGLDDWALLWSVVSSPAPVSCLGC
jgi:hypothetical protein